MRYFITISKKAIQILPPIKGSKNLNNRTLEAINIKKLIFEKKGNQKLNTIPVNRLLHLP